jgi:hypothetical protein
VFRGKFCCFEGEGVEAVDLILEDEVENLWRAGHQTVGKLLGHRRRAEAMWGFQAAELECLPLWLAVETMHSGAFPVEITLILG